MRPLVPPFPWFGGKRTVAHVVWERFGDVRNYVEPFAGSLAVLLGRTTPPRKETVNDMDAYVTNFFRAVAGDPDEVARWADDRTDEIELRARHRWLVARGADLRTQLIDDTDYFDAKIAGWWLWGICLWVGEGWCAQRSIEPFAVGAVRERPNERDSVRRPHLGRPIGVHRLKESRPQLNNRGVHSNTLQTVGISEYMHLLADRLANVRVLCGDWTRCLSYSSLDFNGTTGLFLDPPYSTKSGRNPHIYSQEDTDVAHAVREWAVANGDNPDLRIALCGYEGEHEMPDTWSVHAWSTQGGFGNRVSKQGKRNKDRERIWFSPHCLSYPLFNEAAAS